MSMIKIFDKFEIVPISNLNQTKYVVSGRGLSQSDFQSGPEIALLVANPT